MTDGRVDVISVPDMGASVRIILVTILLLFGAGAAQAEWRRAESDNFIVYAEMSESDIRDHALELERFDRLLRHLSGTRLDFAPIKLRVFVLSDVDEVSEYGGDDDRAGYYSESLRGPFAVVPRRSSGRGAFRLQWREVLFHEYAHHFMKQYFPAAYPAWYIEGYAEMYATVRFRDDNRIDLGRPSSVTTNTIFMFGGAGLWMPMDLLLSNEYPNNPMTYAQGWLLVHRAAFDPAVGRELTDYLNAIIGGATGREAYQRVFADRDPPLDDDLIEYISDRRVPYLPLEVDLGAVAEPRIEAISDDEAEIALLYGREAEALLEAARQAVEQQPDHPQAQAEYARALIEQERPADAVATADRALALDPDHIDAHLFKAEALRGLATEADDPASPYWAQSRDHALQANRANPDSAMALVSYFLSYPDGVQRPANALPALEQAFALVPQSSVARLLLGREYLDQGRFDEAGRVVSAIARSAHGYPQQDLAIIIEELAERELNFEHVDQVIAEINAERERLRQEAEAASTAGEEQLIEADGDAEEAPTEPEG